MKNFALNVFFIPFLLNFASDTYAEVWTVVNDSDTSLIESSDITTKTENGFTGSFRKTDKTSKEIVPLVINVACDTKFYELKDKPKSEDDSIVISNGIANPDHKLYSYIIKACK